MLFFGFEGDLLLLNLRILNIFKSGEISPNLVTLLAFPCIYYGIEMHLPRFGNGFFAFLINVA